MARAPMTRFPHPPFRQMQSGRTHIFGKPGITGDQQPRQAIKFFRQSPPPSRVTGAHHHYTVTRQSACGPRPIGLAVVGHQDQGQACVEAALLSC